MGINNSFAKLLFYCKKQGIKFDKTITLGRMKLYIEKNKLQQIANDLGIKEDLSAIQKDTYAEGLFKLLGARQADSMDYSEYENATIIHDLNKPIPDNLRNTYDFVLDSGTLEHVFNFPVSIRSCMDALKVGGHFVAITPANNMMGHGFYQFSPELYFRILGEKNGFRTKLVLIGACNDAGEVVKWFKVTDPDTVKQRVVLCNGMPSFMAVVAEKTESKKIFDEYPYQSDYVSVWESSTQKKLTQMQKLKKKIKRVIPVSVADYLYTISQIRSNHTKFDNYIGEFNLKHYQEFSFNETLQ